MLRKSMNSADMGIETSKQGTSAQIRDSTQNPVRNTNLDFTEDERNWQNSDLCTQCQKVNLDDVMAYPIINNRYNRCSANVELSISEGSTCPLCRFYISILPDDYQLKPGKSIEIRLERWSSYPDYIDIQFRNNGGSQLSCRRETIRNIVPVGNGEPSESHHPDIQTQSIDYKVVKRWITQCEINHTELCREPRLQPVAPSMLRLIDCKAKIVTILPDLDRYAALSYVWGPPSGESRQSSPMTGLKTLDGSIIQLPRVIEDAMAVTLQIGLRYLWVDQICINQDNAEEKRQQLRHMDSIYHHAYVTIVAAAGDRSSHGLPGVQMRPREKRPRIKLNGKKWAARLQYPGDSLSRSAWSTRGWTFQESFFSRRLLVFTDEQVMFECGALLELEDHHLDLPALRRGWRINRYHSHFEYCGENSNPSGLMPLLRDYFHRKLTYDDDILNAVEGLFTFCAHLKPSIETYWGVPIRWTGYTMMNKDRDSLLADTHILKQDDIAGALLWGLQWYPSDYHPPEHPITERKGFPSWSWAGWKASVDEMSLGCDIEDSFVIPVHVETQDGRLVAVNEAFANGLASGKSYETLGYTPILRLETEVLNVPFVEWKDYKGCTAPNGILYIDHLLLGDSTTFSVVHYIGSRRKALVWPLSFTHSLPNTHDICHEPGKMTVVCVIIAHKYGLLVQSRGGVSKRVGLVRLEATCLTNGQFLFGLDDPSAWEWTKDVQKRDLRDYFSHNIQSVRLG
ncbi:HET-domain-containing protein [Corynespora cassiicola Philippines]|uniref:HET-domain-containing protein n=1 Tax=Corynespora cassiicola Philippines TaxID=1448308 RepID=A0A2T2N3Q9_CORCC|nr:HET-domain-containing protein [Corynespora cassiicola Philippines]